MKLAARLLLSGFLLGGLGLIIGLGPRPLPPAHVATTTPAPPRDCSAGKKRESSARAEDSLLAAIERAAPSTAQGQPGFEVADAFAALDALADADATFLFEAYSELIAKLVERGDYLSVRTILETTPHPQVRTLLFAAFGDVWGRHDPAAAAAWIASLPEWPDRARVLGDIVSTWAARDPQAAARAVLSWPTGEVRQTALANLVLQWRVNDLAGASEWLSARDVHPDFDHAIAALATDSRLVAIAPRQAMGWAEGIIGEKVRLDTMSRVARSWAERDDNAARQHLETSPLLTPGQRFQLLSHLTSRNVEAEQ